MKTFFYKCPDCGKVIELPVSVRGRIVCAYCGSSGWIDDNNGNPVIRQDGPSIPVRQYAEIKKKKSSKKIFIGALVAFLIFCYAIGSNPSKEGTSTSKSGNKTGTKNEETAKKETAAPDIKLENDFEKAVWEATKKAGGQLTQIETVKQDDKEISSVIAGVLIKNDEDVVNNYLKNIAELVQNDDSILDIAISFGDKSSGEDAPLLLMGVVDSEGNIKTSMESIDYNSKRNLWIRGQFSPWDGSHDELKKIVIKNLNDEKSFKHINTEYIDIKDEETRDKINKIIADAGFSNRVEVNDLWITMEFSAKNAFNATIKNTAYGIASYTNNTITLIDIE